MTSANVLTSGNLAAGFAALLLAAHGELVWAAGLVGGAAIFDALDGFVARQAASEGAFGARLDSLADLVSFGAAPALLLYTGGLHEIPIVGVGVCLAFVLCGGWRLARFSVVECRVRFVGLPIPPAGLVAAALAASPVPAPVVCALTALGALLMVSQIPFPTLATIARRARRPRAREVAIPLSAEPAEQAARSGR